MTSKSDSVSSPVKTRSLRGTSPITISNSPIGLGSSSSEDEIPWVMSGSVDTATLGPPPLRSVHTGESIDSETSASKARRAEQIVNTYLEKQHSAPSPGLKTIVDENSNAHESDSMNGSVNGDGNGNANGDANGDATTNGNGVHNHRDKRNATRASLASKNLKKLDEFGFIVNLDDTGVINTDGLYHPGGAYTPSSNEHNNPANQKKNSTPKKTKRLNKKENKQRKRLQKRREKKWRDMLKDWPNIKQNKAKNSKMRSRIRKGIPNSIRGEGWTRLSGVTEKVSNTKKGVYAQLVAQSCDDRFDGIHEALVPFLQEDYHVDPSGDNMKETIERDINRTYPRHSMFYDSLSDSDSGDDSDDASYDKCSYSGSMESFSENNSNNGGSEADSEEGTTEPLIPSSTANASDQCWTKSVEVFNKAASHCPPPFGETKKEGALVQINKFPPSPAHTRDTNALSHSHTHGHSRKEKKKVDIKVEKGGQASLRRVLRAYNSYDPEVGYCQGMNFIAGMFITYVPEEEAFWLLVHVMNEPPCRMRGLFGVGMLEAHQVLYVAEKLIAQFLPRLSRHFDRENIHVTMFATQWLLTMYTSSFPFNVVTRIWDCYLSEGWKVAYRVMLALLDTASSDLMKMRFEDILNYLKEFASKVDANHILEHAFKIQLKKKHIAKYAKEWEAKQEEKEARKSK